MATGDGWVRSGIGYKSPAHTVYLKKHGTLDAFAWGGDCMTIGDSSENLGSITATTKQNARMGGVMRDGGKLLEMPGESTFDLTMKEIDADRKSHDLKTCYWDVDRRTQCRDQDSADKWEKILRHCDAKFGDRTTSGSSWEGEEESLITMSAAAVYSSDVFRVTGEGDESAVSESVHILDVAISRPAGCPTCDDQEDCVVVACSSLEAAATPYLFINYYGGDLDQWGTGIALTAWAVGDADCVIALGDFIVVGSNAENAIIYSDDLGTTQVEVTTNVAGPNDLDAIDQTFIVCVEDSGVVIASRDAARTWEVLDNGVATAQNLNVVMIARDDPQVIYACGASNAFIKSTNGGENWFALTGPSAGDGLTAMWVKDKYNVLVGNDDGELWETTDGGNNWTQQNALPDTPAVTASLNGLTGCGCDVMYAVMEDTTATSHVVYRNVDGGASGKWYHAYTVKGTTTTYAAPSQPPLAVACCDANRAIIAGGATTTPLFYLLA